MMIEHATARRLERAGIAPGGVAAAMRRIDALPRGVPRMTEIRRLETATGGLLQTMSPTGRLDAVADRVGGRRPDDTLLSSIRLDEHTVWEADSLCRSDEGIPVTLRQGVDGLPLRSVVDHPDLPDATLVVGRTDAAPHALFATDGVVRERLPEATFRDRQRWRRDTRALVRRERLETIDGAVRRSWAAKGLLLFGGITILYWLSAFSATGWSRLPDPFQLFCGGIVTLVPILTVWNVMEGNPLINRWVQRPATEAAHREHVERRHAATVGHRDRIQPAGRDGAAVL